MSTPNHMNNLTTLLKRLEAATCRLEEIASAAEFPNHDPSQANTTLVPKNAPKGPLSAAKEASETLPVSLDDFDAFLNNAIDKYSRLSNEIGGLVAQQAAEVLRAFNAQRNWLLITTKAARPADPAIFGSLLGPTTDAVKSASELRDANRQDALFNHLASVADGMIMLGWVTLDHRPFVHVEDALGSAQFFGNRVLRERKNKDSKDTEWVHAFYQIFKDLVAYVKRHHANGVIWNSEGEPAEKFVGALSLGNHADHSGHPCDSASRHPPPPPPPGPPPVLDINDKALVASTQTGLSGFNAVFSELNKGESVTKGLRKVGKSEMTHQNPTPRGGSMVSNELAQKGPAPGKKPKPESMRLRKIGKKELQGQKWTLENFEKDPSPIEIEASLSHSVLISRCNNTAVVIKVDTLVSTVDVVNANNFALQVLGVVPAVMLDNVDGAQVFLSKESSNTKIFTSKCAGINLNIVHGPEDDYKEVPLPSQICSSYDVEKDSMMNEIVALAG